MVRPHRDKIGDAWPVELDIVFVGGKTKGGGQGKTDQVPVMIAVEIRRREVRDPKANTVMKRALAGRIRLQKLPDKSAASVDTFAKDCLPFVLPGFLIAKMWTSWTISPASSAASGLPDTASTANAFRTVFERYCVPRLVET